MDPKVSREACPLLSNQYPNILLYRDKKKRERTFHRSRISPISFFFFQLLETRKRDSSHFPYSIRNPVGFNISIVGISLNHRGGGRGSPPPREAALRNYLELNYSKSFEERQRILPQQYFPSSDREVDGNTRDKREKIGKSERERSRKHWEIRSRRELGWWFLIVWKEYARDDWCSFTECIRQMERVIGVAYARERERATGEARRPPVVQPSSPPLVFLPGIVFVPSLFHPLRAPPLTRLSLTPGKGILRGSEGLPPVLDASRGIICLINGGRGGYRYNLELLEQGFWKGCLLEFGGRGMFGSLRIIYQSEEMRLKMLREGWREENGVYYGR